MIISAYYSGLSKSITKIRNTESWNEEVFKKLLFLDFLKRVAELSKVYWGIIITNIGQGAV